MAMSNKEASEARYIRALFGEGKDHIGAIGREVVILNDHGTLPKGTVVVPFMVDGSGDYWAFEDDDTEDSNCIGKPGIRFAVVTD